MPKIILQILKDVQAEYVFSTGEPIWKVIREVVLGDIDSSNRTLGLTQASNEARPHRLLEYRNDMSDGTRTSCKIIG